MKKTLLCLFALLLSVTAVNAQKVGEVMKAPADAMSKKEALRVAKPMAAPSVPNRIALDEGERIMGFYNTDELDLSGYSSIGLIQYPGSYSAGAVFTPDVVTGFSQAVGGQITKVRFALFESIGETTVRVYSVNVKTNEVSEDALTEEKIGNTVQGWNDVVLSNPVTVEPNTGYLISYDYTQKSSNYPLLVDAEINPNGETSGGFMVYGNLGQGFGWYTVPGAGNLCIQFVVKGGSYIDSDITLTGLTVDSKYVKDGSTLNYNLGIVNIGNNVPTSYTLEVSVDGDVVGTVESPVTLTNSTQTIKGNVNIPSGLAVGKHTVSVAVTKINGETPTENVDDDKVEAPFYVYSESMPRQMNLIEEYTSTLCQYCPLGHELLDKLEASRNDVIVVATHNSAMGSTDPFITDESDALAGTFMGNGLPCASFNRYYNADEGALSISMGYNENYFDMVVDQVLNPFIEQTNSIPTFASVNIDNNYNADSNELKITVSGEAVSDFKKFVGEDAALTVYLLEDGLVATQINANPYPHYDKEYVHNNVLRDVVSKNVYGDAISWTDDTHYSNSYTVTLDKAWNAKNMRIVAFISRPVLDNSYIDDVWVNNANVAPVNSEVAGIGGIVNNGDDVKEVARYGVDGSKISAPVKGINIVKMSDGTTRKVVVAE